MTITRGPFPCLSRTHDYNGPPGPGKVRAIDEYHAAARTITTRSSTGRKVRIPGRVRNRPHGSLWGPLAGLWTLCLVLRNPAPLRIVPNRPGPGCPMSTQPDRTRTYVRLTPERVFGPVEPGAKRQREA